MTGAEIYICANGGVLILILGQLFSISRRLGCGDSMLEQLKKRCPIFVNEKGGQCGKTKETRAQTGAQASPSEGLKG
jgi:hypothetical protein